MLKRWTPIAIAAICALGVGAGSVWYGTHRGPIVRKEALKAVDRPSVRAAAPIGSTTGAPSSFEGRLLWRAVDERGVDSPPDFDADWSKEGRQLVDVSVAVAAAPTWQVGDPLTIDLPPLGKRFESTIERIDQDPARYSRSIRALVVDDNGHDRRLVMTVGPTRVYAYVDTAVGPFELVGDTRLGWLLPSSSMMASWDFSKPDYILPEPDEVGDAR